MNTLQELYEQLEKYKDHNIDDNSNKFLDVAEQIVFHNDPASMPILLKYFSDDEDTMYDWVGEILMSYLEGYDSATHVKVLLENLPIIVSNAPFWAGSMFNSILNERTCKQLFIDNVHLAPKEALLTLFDIIDKRYDHHMELIKDLRAKLLDGNNGIL